MNSMSRPHVNEDPACGCRKEKEREKEANVILKCKTGCPVSVTASPAGTEFPIIDFSINTKNFNDPCIKLEFASNIVSVVGPGETLTLNFQMYKFCKGDLARTKFGPEWSLVRAGVGTLHTTFTDIISFFNCDCDCDCDCDFERDDCCNYSVVVTAVGNGHTATIKNPTFSALVVEKACRCK